MVNPSDVLELPGDPVLLLGGWNSFCPHEKNGILGLTRKLKAHNTNKWHKTASNVCTNVNLMAPCSIQALSKTSQLKSKVADNKQTTTKKYIDFLKDFRRFLSLQFNSRVLQ